jgi:hypothetical protein
MGRSAGALELPADEQAVIDALADEPAAPRREPSAGTGEAMLAEASDRIDELEYVLDTPAGEYLVTGKDELTRMLDSPRSTPAIVAANLETLRRVSGRRSFHRVVQWVDAVRPVLLDREADRANEGAAYAGAASVYVVSGGMVVPDGSSAHRELVARDRWLARFVRPLVRVRDRGRARRGRRSTSRTSARSPGREPEPEPPCSPQLDLGAAA